MLVLVAWTGQSGRALAADAPGADRQTFFVKGVIQEFDPDGKTVVIQHEAISNYMAAMTMPFEVRDTNQLRGLKPGDPVAFHLVVTKKEGWIDDIAKRTDAAPPPVPVVPSHIEISHAVPELAEGDLLPDGHFTNELGEAVNLSQFKGDVLALTFFYTSCPYPNFCPRLTSNFADAATQLAQMPNAPAHWHLLSISFDPKTDTPQRLLDYGKIAHYDPAHWSFLTGDKAQIAELADSFGENYWLEGGTISHNVRTVVVDAHGHVRKILKSNNWTGADLVKEMLAAASQ